MLSKLRGYWYFLNSHINFIFQSKINIKLSRRSNSKSLVEWDLPGSVGKLRVCNFYLQPHNVSLSSIIPALFSFKHDTCRSQLTQTEGRNPCTHTPLLASWASATHSCAFTAVLPQLHFTLTENPTPQTPGANRTGQLLSRSPSSPPATLFIQKLYNPDGKCSPVNRTWTAKGT